MTYTTTLTLFDGVRIVTPDSLELITPYVLREQQDWFEDEIKFLRRLLQAGQKVIDVVKLRRIHPVHGKHGGAGRARRAFEPASDTAHLLAEGIAANGFAQVTLAQCALSSASGTAQLSLSEHSELNALVHGPAAATSATRQSLW